MSDYKKKLRSSKKSEQVLASNNKQAEDEKRIIEEKPLVDEVQDLLADERPECPKTPPTQSIASYFPPSPYGKKRHQVQGDRSIPCRERNITRDFKMMVSTSHVNKDTLTEENKKYNAFFRAELLDDLTAWEDFDTDSLRLHRRICQYTKTSATIPNFLESTQESIHQNRLLPDSPQFQILPIGKEGRRILMKPSSTRLINTTPIKILDAPDLKDNFYMSLVDWGSNDCLAVGLGSSVYIYDPNTSQVRKVYDAVTDIVTSVSWSTVGSLLSIGTNSGKVILYDTKHLKRIRTWTNHCSRVGAMTWKSNIFSTGGLDGVIYHHDVRSPNSHFIKMLGHTDEVCTLKWNTEGTMLASGGNDSRLVIWDSHTDSELHRFTQHIAAVKAISWSPHKRGILVSGGGSKDKTIKFWNTISGELKSSHDVRSQICNIEWSKKTDEIVSSHGYAAELDAASNEVVVWKPDNMRRLATLTGHTSRVLYMAMSIDGNTVVTGAGDETLRFWDIFSSAQNPQDKRTCIR